MATLKRNLNLAFLGVLVIIVVAMSAGAVYFHYTLSDLSNKNSEKISEAEKLRLELAATSADVEEKKEQLTVRKEREDDLSIQYTEVTSENKNLKDETTRLQDSLETTNKAKAALETENTDLKKKNTDLEKDIDTLKKSVTQLQAEIARLTNSSS